MRERDYQTEAHEAVIESWGRVRSTLVVMATGTGKTVLFSHIAKTRVQAGRVLVIAHREELVSQAARKIEMVTGKMPDIDMANRRVRHDCMYASPFVVASVQSLQRRIDNYPMHKFGTLIIDEAHHATAATYRKVFNRFMVDAPDSKVLGVTATPDRSDDRALGLVFDEVAYEMDLPRSIQTGWLTPIQQTVLTVKGLDFSGLHTRAGDFVPAELNQIMEDEEPAHQIVTGIIEHSKQRQTIVFCSSVKHAEMTTHILNRHLPNSARLVTGATEGGLRREMFDDFRHRRFPFLVNVAVATEGTDVPGIEVVAVAQPTMSRARYMQMIGRGLRPLDGTVDPHPTPESRLAAIAASAKPHCHVIDFTGNTGRHRLVTTADILGGDYSDAVRKAALKRAKDSSVDMSEALRIEHEKELERIRRAMEKRKAIVAKAQYEARDHDPFSLFNDAPEGQDRKLKAHEKPTEKQQAYLRKNGHKNPERYTKRQASAIISKLEKNASLQKKGYPTQREMMTLQSMGYDIRQISASDARLLLKAKAEAQWQDRLVDSR